MGFMEFTGYGIFEYLGIIFAAILLIVLLITTVALTLGYFLVKRDKLLFPKILLYIANNFYSALLRVFLLVGTEDTFYKAGIDFYNRYYSNKFKKARNKVLVLPHCLRDLKCPGKLGLNGVECVHCGRCSIGDIIKVAEKNNYKVFIVPGSTFLKRVLKEHRPGGVFGVACYSDLFHAMNYLSRKGVPTQGQPLIKDGCVNTLVDVEELISRLSENSN
jgi:hypothetical protein